MPLSITLISPGRTKETWLRAGIAEYIKRLQRYCRVDLIDVQDVSDQKQVEQVLAQEGRHLLQRIRPQDYVIALDLTGRQLDSPQLAENLMAWFETGGSSLVFVIGGANGLDQSVVRRAQQRLSLSRLTWTHQMTRLLLLEQCYRCFRLLHNEPYHK